MRFDNTIAPALLALIIAGPVLAQQKMTAPQLSALAASGSADLGPAIRQTFSAKALQAGTAWSGRSQDFFFATEAASRPELFIDDQPGPKMNRIESSNLWYAVAKIQPLGTLHSYFFTVNGDKFGGQSDMPAFGPLSYQTPGVPAGTLSEKLICTSRIYDGMKSEYWIYVPAQYDPKVPAALMVFQDGGGYLDRGGMNPALNVIDNLIAQKKIPVMICVFINPGDISGAPGTPTYNFVKGYGDKWKRDLKDSMRSTLYDTVSDRYPRFLRDEVLAEVQAKYNIRRDAYSRAITGISSGGICSFNAAWQIDRKSTRLNSSHT
jgi:enterochelin esterase family protein